MLLFFLFLPELSLSPSYWFYPSYSFFTWHVNICEQSWAEELQQGHVLVKKGEKKLQFKNWVHWVLIPGPLVPCDNEADALNVRPWHPLYQKLWDLLYYREKVNKQDTKRNIFVTINIAIGSTDSAAMSCHNQTSHCTLFWTSTPESSGIY